MSRPRPLGKFFDRQTGKERKIRPVESGPFVFDGDDWLLLAMLCDPVMCAELLGEDPSNHEYAGCFTVRDYQFPLFRPSGNYTIAACARKVGKTESVKWDAVSHAFRRIGEKMLITAPELIHLLPLTDQIEDKVRALRLTRDFLDTRGGKTGFTHRPFGVDFVDGTKIVGRIPRLTGTGVKGQHEPDLRVDEGQDYPEKGWTEVHETVTKDHVDSTGRADFTYRIYGVHSGAQNTKFHQHATKGAFRVTKITALQRPGWDKAEKKAAKSAYGGSSAPDYRRNILGEAGGASSPFFVTARLFQCVDQDRESAYNSGEYKHQLLRVEDFDEMGLPISEALDLPLGYKNVYVGADMGLNQSPTVITVFNEAKYGNRVRLKLIRRFTLERMRTKNLRHAIYAIAWAYGTALKGFGMDVTGLGLPIWQEIEDDEVVPQHLLDVSTGYFFNAKHPIHVDESMVAETAGGQLRDHLGNAVVKETDPNTNEDRYVTYMPMVEASTRYLREDVDQTRLLLPFDPEITGDMQGETAERLKRIAGLKQKPNAFHILDSMRAMAMRKHGAPVVAMLAPKERAPVFDSAVETGAGRGGLEAFAL